MNKFLKDILENWTEFLPYWEEMKNCPQSPCWHAEGNVDVHTEMVLDEFEKMNKENLSEKQIQIINYALLLHDIAKPIVLTIEDGLYRSHNHTSKGAKIVWQLLETTNLPLEDRREITNLVFYHGKPIYVGEKETLEQEKMVIKMSIDCNLENLYYVAICDYNGRVCDDKNEKLDDIEYFKLIAEQLNCYKNEYQFNSNIAKYNYLVKNTHYYTDNPYDDTKSKVILMVGLPGSGKDTYIKNNFDLPIVSLDNIRRELKIKPTDNQGKVYQEAKKLAKIYLAKGQDFIWNATNLTKQNRQKLINIFEMYNAYIEIHYVATPFQKCIERNKMRTELEIVPDKIINKMKNKLEPPMNYEVHKVIYYE